MLLLFQPHPIVLKLHDGNYIQDIPFETSELPMLVPPIPWHLPDRGGYLLNQRMYFINKWKFLIIG